MYNQKRTKTPFLYENVLFRLNEIFIIHNAHDLYMLQPDRTMCYLDYRPDNQIFFDPA